MPRLGSTRGCWAQRRQHRRPGHALMGTMDFKTDASAVTINLLLIVRPEEAASKEKGQREGRTEGGRGAGNIAPAPGEGGQGCSCTRRRQAAALEQDSGFLSSFCSLHTCCQTPKCQLLCGSPACLRWCSRALLEPRSELRPVRLQCVQPRVHGQGHAGTLLRGVCLHLAGSCPAPRCPHGLSGLCKGSRERARHFTPHQHPLPWSTGAELFCLQRARALSPRLTVLSHL